VKDDHLSLGDLARKVVDWANDRKIIQNGRIETQGLKLVSEIGELADNLVKGQDITDDIGDSMVVLIIIAEMYGVSARQCLQLAYDTIKVRTGYLNENGVFIKDGQG
jgi:uncharacterized protein YabN with tetrapyrrole methylase and pyrophosphatase domain